MMPKPCLTLLVAALSLPMAACATSPAQPPKACDGHHRRPANPNGSVLSAADAGAPAEPAGEADKRPRGGGSICR